MRTDIFTVMFFPIFLALVFMPIGSRAFVWTKSTSELRPTPPSSQLEFLEKSTVTTRARHVLQGNRIDDDNRDSTDKNIAFATLSTDRDNKPNRGNFFYNDEVISHLYGYMYLVGLFAAQDALFLGNFLVLSSVTAWATQQKLLPCNPRIPALTAAMTLTFTFALRYIIGFEPPLEALLGDTYQGPTESSALFELVICLLNVGWGLFGSWRTKEQVNGATYGF